MNINGKPLVFLCLIITLSFTVNLASAQSPEQWEEQDAVLVGRISHVEGQLSRFDPEADDWVSTTREAPFGIDDLLSTDPESRAEIIMPNNTWARINGDTRIQLTALTPQITDVDLTFGNGRFYNKSSETEINATTPFGRITAPPGSAFDLYVGEDGVDVIAVKNSVYFHHNASSRRHEVRSDSSAISADTREVTAVASNGDPDWAAWNRNMDALWAGRMDTRGESSSYLPPELRSEAYALDRHGMWERVYYEGRHYRFWRPVQISAGWSPFSWGAWVTWHGDHVWIPHEPFGYVTHHYGNWIFTSGHWYWAPPVTRIMVRAHLPLLHIGFGWYPGRVSWIHHGAHVGWIPLAPYEPYYTHRHWGRRSIVAARRAHFRHRHHHYKHRNHAVVIHRSHFYRSNDYRHARVRDISRNSVRNKFRTTRLLDHKVLKDDRRHRRKDRFHRDRRDHRQHLSGKARHKRDLRINARHAEDKRNLRRDQKHSTKERDLKPSRRRSIQNQQDRRQPRRIRKELKENRLPEKKVRSRSAQRSLRPQPSKETVDKKNRRIHAKRTGDNRHRLADEKRTAKKRDLKPSRNRRIGKTPERRQSPRIDTAPKQRAQHRQRIKSTRPPKGSRSNQAFKVGTDRQKERKFNASVSRRKPHLRDKNERSHRRSQVRQRSTINRSEKRRAAEKPRQTTDYRKKRERLTVRAPAAVRQPSRAVRMPAPKRQPEKTISRPNQQQQRSGQGRQYSSGRRSGGQDVTKRYPAGKGRHQRLKQRR